MKLGALSLLVGSTIARAVASPACAECHSAIFQKQRVSHHAQALRPFAGSRMALALASAHLREENGFGFIFRGSGVTVFRGTERADAALGWAFGAGVQGFTAVGEFQGKYFEHRVSYFVKPPSPGLTPGQEARIPRSADDALGIFKTPEEAWRCFQCHSTGLRRDAEGGPDLAALTPGLTCERCHGPGDAHIAAVRAHRSAEEIRKSIFDAARLPPKASVEVCGECHRTTARPGDPAIVRFQPVGLMASACFRRSSALSCLTCHDPHDDAVRADSAYYDAKCSACHAQCKAGERGNCISCHMGRVALTPSLSFTDHRIR